MASNAHARTSAVLPGGAGEGELWHIFIANGVEAARCDDFFRQSICRTTPRNVEYELVNE
jgi:hypothetical protein